MVYELSAPSWGEEEKNAIMNVVDSGYYTMGSNVKEFEKCWTIDFTCSFSFFSMNERSKRTKD